MVEERPDYDALAQDINLNDITSCERNANILRMLRDGDPNLNKHFIILYEWEHYDEEEDRLDEDFVVREGDDLGWLGYFLGKSEVIQYLQINSMPAGEDNYFFDGMSQNRSIKKLDINNDEMSDSGWLSLCSFLGNNHNLSDLEFQGTFVGHEQGAQNLALALGKMSHNSLEHLSILETQIGDEGIAEIATALRLHPQLNNLRLCDNNNIGRDGCIALANTLSIWPHSNNLEILDLSWNSIDDGGLRAIVSGIMNCHSLKGLYIWGNRSITAAGLRFLFPLFQSEAHSLEALLLSGINFGDDGAISLAEGLRGNTSLTTLTFDVETAGITTIGWSAFSTLLCDTSTVSKTYLSNHTLTMVGSKYNNEGTHVQYLAINEHSNAAICKILQSHPDLDMEPFFKKKMQFLPAVMSWFERVAHIEEQLIEDELIEESERSCQSRKLSALYKFIRGMPDLTIIGYWEGRMIHVEAKKRWLADEMRRLEHEEDITRERLGMSGQLMDEGTNK